MSDQNNQTDTVIRPPSGLCCRRYYTSRVFLLYQYHLITSIWRVIFRLKGTVPAKLFKPYHKSFVYRLLSLKDRSQAKNLFKKYFSQKSQIDHIKLYGFFKTTRIQDTTIELFLAFVSARAFLKLHASDEAFRILDTYISDFGRHVPALKVLKIHIPFCELYLHACAQTGNETKYINMCKSLIRIRPMDWKNYFFLAMNASSRDDKEYLRQMERAGTASGKMSGHAYTLLVDAHVRCGNFDEAYDAFVLGKRNQRWYKDLFLSAAFIENSRLSYDKGYRWIQRYYEACGLSLPDTSATDSFDRCLQSLRFDLPEFSFPGNPKVSVIMTCYNGEGFIDTSIRSVLNQTYKNLELIIVDDDSEDRSTERINAWASKDDRIRLMKKKTNEGTYVSKNRAILRTNGDFITFLDSDDWMHPRRIEQHLKHTPANIVMSYSDWIRITEIFIPCVRQTGGFTHMNSASTFVHKEIFNRIGYFDSVRAGADSEFIWRIRYIYGDRRVKRINLPLSLSRRHGNSLTTSGVAAFNESRISPVRLRYWDAWVKWHCKTANESNLVIPFPHYPRAFEAPDEILVSGTKI